MKIRLLLIAREGASQHRYLESISKYDVEVFSTASFSDLSEDICRHSYHGILLDLQTKMKAIGQNKSYVYGLLDKFPVAQLQIDKETSEIKCFFSNQKTGDTLLDFINSKCRNFVPQKIRTSDRKEICLNVILYSHIDNIDPEYTVTKNISMGGCFIISTRIWQKGDHVWISVNDIQDHDVIECQIRHVATWGKSKRVPGIGVEFVHIKPSQLDELIRYLNR